VVAIFLKKLTAEAQERAASCIRCTNNKTDPRRFFVYEQYKNDAALEAHRASPHSLQMAKKDLPKLGDHTEGAFV